MVFIAGTSATAGVFFYQLEALSEKLRKAEVAIAALTECGGEAPANVVASRRGLEAGMCVQIFVSLTKMGSPPWCVCACAVIVM